MKIALLPDDFSVFQVTSIKDIKLVKPMFIGLTNDEISIVAPTDRVPHTTINCEDGWKAFQIQGVLDFSLVGILAKISSLLAEHSISIFAVSTYNTDYILVKETDATAAVAVLKEQNYEVINA
ncbi:ACT domain-containing protein [Liquorilactobacillus capillatus]|uniref:CASTOR ACT domain-containing protein n=1 Tax=Liquorilactobacillus capillatus DSM 19910 TaxID=1423731 RepID=A0A0R1LZS9_9LACO|nr:ACT domain-containing protein [Liquorilactobacillus capillatus]KRL01143.1 hypothetical protein FC81_GL001282 [Liquorilactobacillus capillatus DSM 19910]